MLTAIAAIARGGLRLGLWLDLSVRAGPGEGRDEAFERKRRGGLFDHRAAQDRAVGGDIGDYRAAWRLQVEVPEGKAQGDDDDQFFHACTPLRNGFRSLRTARLAHPALAVESSIQQHGTAACRTEPGACRLATL